jgi:DNA-binding SARP family transcriptional activator
VRFHILGPLEVHTDSGEAVRLRPPKQRTLLVLLLLRANRPVSKDRLAAAIWPGRPPRSAAGNLRTYMSGLRRVLHPVGGDRLPRLTPEPGGYRLGVPASEVDLLVFEELAANGRRALGGGDTANAARMLREALVLWRGRAAEDVAVDAEGMVTLAGLEERRLAAEEAWIGAQLQLGQEAEVIAVLGGLVVQHPLRERLRAQLMTALYRTGRQAEALAVFRELRRQMVDELGVEPSQSLRRLHEQMLAGDPLEHGSVLRP